MEGDNNFRYDEGYEEAGFSQVSADEDGNFSYDEEESYEDEAEEYDMDDADYDE